MAKHYETTANKQILVSVDKLTAKELKVVKNYIELGYTLIEVQPVKKEVVDEKWTKKGIETFIAKNATDEQKKEYEYLTTKQAVSKKTGKPLFNKNGSPRKVGIVGAFHWLSETFEEYGAEPKE